MVPLELVTLRVLPPGDTSLADGAFADQVATNSPVDMSIRWMTLSVVDPGHRLTQMAWYSEQTFRMPCPSSRVKGMT